MILPRMVTTHHKTKKIQLALIWSLMSRPPPGVSDANRLVEKTRKKFNDTPLFFLDAFLFLATDDFLSG